MTTFSYTSGNPANLVGGATASMADISGPFADLLTFVNGNIDATNLASGAVDVAELASTLAVFLGVTQSGAVRRGKSIIATSETTSATSYAVGNLATPDRVQNIVVPTDGLLFIGYRALVKPPVSANCRAAIFIGANQLKTPTPSAVPAVQEVSLSGGGTPNFSHIGANPRGLGQLSASTVDESDVTTGQALYISDSGGSSIHGSLCVVDVAAGTYDVSVQYKVSTTGPVTVKERKLWVWTTGF